MIVVVADTSPLNYLVLIHCQDLLPALYQCVLVPGAVMEELNHAGTPPLVRVWLSRLPEWIIARQIQSAPDATLKGLDPGEREAIQLAREVQADLLLMDDRIGVNRARHHGLEVSGTLGILIQAARYGLVNIDVALADRQSTDFRCTAQLFKSARDHARLKP